MALSRVVSEILNVEKYRDLEIPVKGYSSSCHHHVHQGHWKCHHSIERKD